MYVNPRRNAHVIVEIAFLCSICTHMCVYIYLRNFGILYIICVHYCVYMYCKSIELSLWLERKRYSKVKFLDISQSVDN